MIRKSVFAVCIALFLAVQTAFTVLAEGVYKKDIENSFIASASYFEKDSFFDGLTFGKADWLAFLYGRLYGENEETVSYCENVLDCALGLTDNEGFTPPTEYIRAIITLSGFGVYNEELTKTGIWYNEDFDRQGFNAYIWALIGLNCINTPAPQDSINNTDSLIEYILSRQLSDGGFTLGSGTKADCDITSSVIYALAPHRDNSKVNHALEKAVECLFSLQQENGGFMSMGVPNCESTAQAIMALSSVGIKDQRITGILSALDIYRNEGGFCHIEGGGLNILATSQGAMALASYELSLNNRYLFYDCINEFNKGEFLYGNKPETTVTTTTTIPPETSPETPEAPEIPSEENMDNNIFIIIGIVLIFSVVIAILLMASAKARGGKTKRAVPFLITLIFLLAIALIVFIAPDINKDNNTMSSSPPGNNSVTGDDTVHFTISCENALDKASPEILSLLPSDGIIFDGEVSFEGEITVFELLCRICKENNIRIEYSYSPAFDSYYIEGISDLYEFDCGESSGWLYKVDDKSPNYGCSAYILKGGEQVEFIYTIDYTEV